MGGSLNQRPWNFPKLKCRETDQTFSNLSSFISLDFISSKEIKNELERNKVWKDETKFCKIIYLLKLLENWNLMASFAFMKCKCFILWRMKSRGFNEYHFNNFSSFHCTSLNSIAFQEFTFSYIILYFSILFLSISFLFLSLSFHDFSFHFLSWIEISTLHETKWNLQITISIISLIFLFILLLFTSFCSICFHFISEYLVFSA